MSLFNQKQGMKAFFDMKEALHKAVYESVGQEILEQSKNQQISINEQLADKIQQFNEKLCYTAKDIIEKQFESKIREIVKEELKLH